MAGFYGESYAVIDTVGIDYDAVFRHYDGLSASVSAGASFSGVSQADSLIFDELAAASDVKVSWVVEVGPGTSGSLACTSGLDPTWSGSASYATEAAGTQTAAGAGTLVFPQTVITKDALVAFDDAPIALFQCVSGTVEVQQVKLRVWPAGGPGGAWTAGPDYDVTRTAIIKSTINVRYTSPTYPDAEVAWSNARAGIDALVGQDVAWGGESVGAGTFGVYGDSGSLGGWFGQGAFTTTVAYDRDGVATRFSVPVDAGVDPRETRYEPTGSVRASAGTQAREQFTGWLPGSTISAYGGGSARIAVEALGAPPVISPDGYGPFIFPTGGQVVDDGTGFPPPASRVFAFTVLPDHYLSYLGVGADSGQAALNPGLSYTARVSGYEFYDPEAVPAPELSPRFFVKHRDDTMRPVGFGKPATERTLFRTLVQGGWYRDLTTAEYATYGPGVRPPGGYPLSVKRVTDGGDYWWDQVAWLVPE